MLVKSKITQKCQLKNSMMLVIKSLYAIDKLKNTSGKYYIS